MKGNIFQSRNLICSGFQLLVKTKGLPVVQRGHYLESRIQDGPLTDDLSQPGKTLRLQFYSVYSHFL